MVLCFHLWVQTLFHLEQLSVKLVHLVYSAQVYINVLLTKVR